MMRRYLCQIFSFNILTLSLHCRTYKREEYVDFCRRYNGKIGLGKTNIRLVIRFVLFDYSAEIISPGSLYRRNIENGTPVHIHMLLEFV